MKVLSVVGKFSRVVARRGDCRKEVADSSALEVVAINKTVKGRALRGSFFSLASPRPFPPCFLSTRRGYNFTLPGVTAVRLVLFSLSFLFKCPSLCTTVPWTNNSERIRVTFSASCSSSSAAASSCPGPDPLRCPSQVFCPLVSTRSSRSTRTIPII